MFYLQIPDLTILLLICLNILLLQQSGHAAEEIVMLEPSHGDPTFARWKRTASMEVTDSLIHKFTELKKFVIQLSNNKRLFYNKVDWTKLLSSGIASACSVQKSKILSAERNLQLHQDQVEGCNSNFEHLKDAITGTGDQIDLAFDSYSSIINVVQESDLANSYRKIGNNVLNGRYDYLGVNLENLQTKLTKFPDKLVTIGPAFQKLNKSVEEVKNCLKNLDNIVEIQTTLTEVGSSLEEVHQFVQQLMGGVQYQRAVMKYAGTFYHEKMVSFSGLSHDKFDKMSPDEKKLSLAHWGELLQTVLTSSLIHDMNALVAKTFSSSLKTIKQSDLKQSVSIETMEMICNDWRETLKEEVEKMVAQLERNIDAKVKTLENLYNSSIFKVV